MESAERAGLSRRSFLAITGTLAGAAAIPGCTTGRSDTSVVPEPSALPQVGLHVPQSEASGDAAAGGDGVGRFLDPQQLAIVTAMAARIIPGDATDPGAIEAGAVEYIDRLLGTYEGYPKRTYTQRPYAQPYEGDEPPPEEDGVVWVRAEEFERYGWQSGFTPREIYRMGLPRLNALAQQREGAEFADLDADQQDALLEAVEDAEDGDVTELFEDLPAGFFFQLVREHVIEGFLGDPLYGGNRELVGWHHIGFPGAQRGYSPSEMLDPQFSRSPQSLGQLPMMHAGHADDAHGGPALGSIRRRHPNGPLD